MSGKTSRTARVHEQDYVAHVPKKGGENAMPPLPWPSSLSPSGLAPVICYHGLPALPPDHPPVGRRPRRDSLGGELPPFGGNSWVRARYARTTFGCIVCAGEPRPPDLTGSVGA